MDKTVLQVPMDISLRQEAEKAAISAGFSSVQEIVRIFLKKLTINSVEFGFYDKVVPMSAKAEKRYTKFVDQINKDKGVAKASSFKDLISILE